MKKLTGILIGLIAFWPAMAQIVFKTVVTHGPFIAGEPFQVQYVMEDVSADDEFYRPDFTGFRVISGPNTYDGTINSTTGTKKLKNVVFTLVAPKAGKLVVPAADARLGDRLMKSDRVVIDMMSREEAIQQGILPNSNGQSGEGVYLRPGQDPQELIRQNLFIRVLIDKRSCYVGEPVTATFKLYSRLQSRSDIIKNPGFYGFTVFDMAGLNDRVATTETINGRKFDVHTVRKVQLYPLRAGSFVIDAMEVQNQVTISKSAVSKKTEQEIVEGVVPPEELVPEAGSIVVENSMHSEPVAISVKSLPEKSRPDSFAGATGRFFITAATGSTRLAKNEEGEFRITISGRGNFTQLPAPVIDWPAGIEGFDPEIKDELDGSQSPLSGERVFHYRFVSSKAGSYTLPSVSFSFFDPDSNRYKIVSTKGIAINVSGEKAMMKVEQKATEEEHYNGNISAWIIISILVLLAIGYAWLNGFFKRGPDVEPAMPPKPARSYALILADALYPATVLIEADDLTFYTALSKGAWNFLAEIFSLKGSAVSKQQLKDAFEGSRIDAELRNGVMRVLEECETGMYTGVSGSVDKRALLEHTRGLLERVANGLPHSEYL